MGLPSNQIICGDCLTAMRDMEPCSIDAVITDPPYGLEFMGKEWDKLNHNGRDRRKAIQKSSFGSIMGAKQETPRITRTSRKKCLRCGGYSGGPFQRCQCAQPQWKVSGYPAAMQRWHTLWATEALRVAKPGAFLLAFGGTRTHHRLMCAIEDAGWEIRDCLMWLYGSGFPKSRDISKAIDKAAGSYTKGPNSPTSRSSGPSPSGCYGEGVQTKTIHIAQSPQARQWSGWGTALKPAWEPIILARKPVEGTVAANVLKYGCGGLNIDGCRIGTDTVQINELEQWSGFGQKKRPAYSPKQSQGRWPANLLLDEKAGKILDEQSGVLATGRKSKIQDGWGKHGIYGRGLPHLKECIASSGGASRFFYCAKAGRKERNRGLEGMPERRGGTERMNNTNGRKVELGESDRLTLSKNTHPTVKPLRLMKYLCKLVTPSSGVILDPFAGSGTTCIAAKELGFNCIGIEKEAEYCEIARRRIAAAKKLKAGQMALFDGEKE